MTTPVLITLDQITPKWLAQALHATFPTQEVISFEQTGNPAFNSQIAHLKVYFKVDEPVQLLIKLNAEDDGRNEVDFYRAVTALSDRARLPMLVPCYSTAYDQDSQYSCCILQDVSDTHEAPVSREQLISGNGIPSAGRLEQIVDAIAQFHAYWWESPQLGHGMAEVRWWYADEVGYREHVTRRQAEWRAFSAAIDWFPADLAALYRNTLNKLPGLWDAYLKDRVLARGQMTLSNGDCYFSQFLCPKSELDAPTYLVDFQDVSANFPPYDLVYMFATFWTPEQRHTQDRERNLLERYLRQLQQFGVNNYTWDKLWTDYRMMIIFMVFDPIWNQVSGSQQTYWWPKLRCLTNAFQDLGCEQLLNELLQC